MDLVRKIQNTNVALQVAASEAEEAQAKIKSLFVKGLAIHSRSIETHAVCMGCGLIRLRPTKPDERLPECPVCAPIKTPKNKPAAATMQEG